MEEKDSKELGIKTISDLSEYVKNHPDKVKFGCNAEFYGREDGYPALEKAYDLQIKEGNIIKMNIGLLYKAIKEDEVNVTVGFKTDGRIEAYDLVSLKDNKQFFPVYNPAPVVRKEVIEKYPGLKDVFAELKPVLDLETIRKLNYRVDIEHDSAKDAAKNWLQEEGLIE
jgi:osmoprotectant transport system substrate-binding protein